jgi:nucleotide-binding universal stress UspA family protein
MPENPASSPGHTTIVVGVLPGQPDDVVLQAALFAKRFNAELICANVDVTRYTVEELSDGSVSAFPIDPDQAEVVREEIDPAFATQLEHLLSHQEIAWSFRELAGEPARELARLADHVNAECIVVGTRHAGFRASAREFFTGSVAVHLVHRQHRPVVVIPLEPVPHGSALPWEDR